MRRMYPERTEWIPRFAGFRGCLGGPEGGARVPECTRMYPNVPECTRMYPRFSSECTQRPRARRSPCMAVRSYTMRTPCDEALTLGWQGRTPRPPEHPSTPSSSAFGHVKNALGPPRADCPCMRTTDRQNIFSGTGKKPSAGK